MLITCSANASYIGLRLNLPPTPIRQSSNLVKVEAAYGLPLLRLGFRPFYLGAAAYAAIAVPLWVAVAWGVLTRCRRCLPTRCQCPPNTP